MLDFELEADSENSQDANKESQMHRRMSDDSPEVGNEKEVGTGDQCFVGG